MATKRKERWSREVTEKSNALDLEKEVFAEDDPHRIALSLKRSAEHSERRKSSPYRSAMSMLTFYLNRAGRSLSQRRRERLEAAKDELRRVFRKPARG
ncbi:MAG: DUF3175 domain-containing protein [Chloroflexi bacterium]|nr:MAG: DUF3175 domain-containing protein [Chloroflexota bacterium]